MLAARPASGEEGRGEIPLILAPPTAQGLLRDVRAALPAVPIRLRAELQSKNPSGDIEQTAQAEIHLNWGARTPQASYTIRDAFGADRARFVIRWPKGRNAEYEYYEGNPLQAATPPDLFEQIEGMDFSWADLSLHFLWWPGGRISGSGEKRGRFCYILDIPSPDDTTSYAGVRLWIDPEVHALLQAEAYNAKKENVRRLQVKSFKKINGLWTIQDLEVKSFPSRHKTVLRVRDIEAEDG